VLSYKKPNTGKIYPAATPPESDEFNDSRPGLQWQWQANPKPYWAFSQNGKLRLFSYQVPDSLKNYWDVPNLLMQKFPAEEFTVTTKLSFHPRLVGEKAGLIIHGSDYAYLAVEKRADADYFSFGICHQADKGKEEKYRLLERDSSAVIYFRVSVAKGGICTFSYSENGNVFIPIEEKLVAKPGRWVGAKVGLFCTRVAKTNDSGFVDVDWFRVEK
jgi:beta-xylosidase